MGAWLTGNFAEDRVDIVVLQKRRGRQVDIGPSAEMLPQVALIGHPVVLVEGLAADGRARTWITGLADT